MKGLVKNIVLSAIAVSLIGSVHAAPNVAELAQEISGVQLAQLNASVIGNAASSGFKTTKAVASNSFKAAAQFVADKSAKVASGDSTNGLISVSKAIGSVFTGIGIGFLKAGSGIVSYGNLWKTKPGTALAGTVVVGFACYGLHSAGKDLVDSFDSCKKYVKNAAFSFLNRYMNNGQPVHDQTELEFSDNEVESEPSDNS